MERAMLLRKRRAAENWNLDLTEESRDSRPALRERFASSGKLWLFAALVVAAVSVILIVTAFRIDIPSSETESHRHMGRPSESYADRKHTDFIEGLVRKEKRRGVDITARYVAADEIYLTVPSDIGSDELDFIVRYAGTGTMNRFGISPIMLVFTPSKPGGPADRLLGVWEWSTRDNDFVLRKGPK